MVTIKSKKEIEIMKEACKVVALTHKAIKENIKPGMTTWELNQIVEKVIDTILETFNNSFSKIYTEEEKRVLIMIILEKYEEGLYNE